MQELEDDTKQKKAANSPKSAKNIPSYNNSGLWKSIFGYFKGPPNGETVIQKEQEWNMIEDDPD